MSNVETRQIETIYEGRRQADGGSTMIVVCPFCGAEVEVYLWSFAGCGKRCDCGAKLYHIPHEGEYGYAATKQKIRSNANE